MLCVAHCVMAPPTLSKSIQLVVDVVYIGRSYNLETELMQRSAQ